MARYCFLLEKEKLENKYGLKFPLGAGKKVDKFSNEFINKFGIKEFEKIAKKNFANYREVLEEKLF
jgi:ribonuclease HIII